MNLSWFAWNPITGLFESEDEVWEPLIKVSYIYLILWNDNNINKCILYSYKQTQLLKNGEREKKIEIQHFEKLFDLFSKDMANGEGCIGSKEKAHWWEQEKEDSVNLEENVDGFNEFCMSNVESYFLIDSHSYSCETSSKKTKKPVQMVEILEKQMYIFQFEIDNMTASVRQGNKIAKEGLVIMERGRPDFYFEDEVFSELVKVGIYIAIWVRIIWPHSKNTWSELNFLDLKQK